MRQLTIASVLAAVLAAPLLCGCAATRHDDPLIDPTFSHVRDGDYLLPSPSDPTTTTPIASVDVPLD